MAVVVALSVGTAACVLVPVLRAGIDAPALDTSLDTLTTVVTLAVAVLAWVRFRQRGDPVAAFQAAAFTVLAIANGLAVAAVTAGLDARVGMALASPSQAPIYVFTIARILAAALLVLGSLASLRERLIDHGRAIVVGSAIAIVTAIALIELGAGRLPPLASLGIADLVPAARGAAPLPSSLTPLGGMAQIAGATLFLWAAGLSRRLNLRDGLVIDKYMTIGLVFAAFAQVHTAIFPGTYTGLVTSGDVLRLAFDVTLLLGIQAEAAAILRSLRSANEDLDRLRLADVQRAGLEERARLSRELHDGLAQNLWLAKLTTGRLAGLADLAPEARALAGDLRQTIDAGIAEAQEAIVALREPTEAVGSSFSELLSRCVYEFGDRFGVRVEFTLERDLPQLTPRAQAEALRIAQEALNNVRRHADATVVRVRAGVESGRLVVVVGDNGRGFDPKAVGRTAFGLASMRERAAQIGGELHIDSRPLDGTRISLLVPLTLAAVAIPVGAG